MTAWESRNGTPPINRAGRIEQEQALMRDSGLHGREAKAKAEDVAESRIALHC